MELNRSEAAQALGIDPTTLDAWTRQGAPVLHKAGKGNPSRYSVPALVAWKIQHETDRALAKLERQAKPEEIDALKARRLELDNERRALDLAKAKGEVAPISEIAAVFGRRIIATRSALMDRVPLRVASELARDPAFNSRELVRREMRQALEALSVANVVAAFAEAGLRVGVEHIAPCETCRQIAEAIDRMDSADGR